MAITDINISEELTTNAPSIKYRGNEGPKSPEEQKQLMMAQLEEEYSKYVFEMEEQGLQPMSFQQFIEQAMAEGQISSAQRMPNRQIAAYGGRARYGLGSFVKKFTRPIKKVVSKVGDVASSDLGKAALTAAGIYGLGGGFGGPGNWGLNKGFSFGKMLPNIKSGLTSLKPQYFKPSTTKSMTSTGLHNYKTPSRFSKMISNFPGGKIGLGLTASSLLPLAGIGMEEDEVLEDFPIADKISQSFDIDYSKMRQEIAEAAQRGAGLDEIKAIQVKYGVTPSTLGSSWDTIKKSAEGGRINRYSGGLSIPSQNTMQDAIKTSMQDKMGGITDVMKQADLYREGDVGQMYMNQGGRIGADEGGLMDLGGMEKDYRAEGGFVPIGKKEKADDVPARLSVNEFVMTADAVRGAGDGDIDKGSEVMEGIMENFEEKGKAMKGAMMPMKSKMKPLSSRRGPMESGVGKVLRGALEATGAAPSANVPMEELETLFEGIRNVPDDQMKMAGPDWYIKRIEHLIFLGYSYDEAAEIAYDSDKYYEAIGLDPFARKQGAQDMFEVSERLSEVV